MYFHNVCFELSLSVLSPNFYEWYPWSSHEYSEDCTAFFWYDDITSSELSDDRLEEYNKEVEKYNKYLRDKEREQGLISRDRLRDKILDKDIVIKTIKDKSGKYGRYLGIIYFDGVNINDWLVEEGLAVKAEY